MLKTKVLAQERTIALGLDVDAQTVAVAALDVSNGEILLQGRLSPAAEGLADIPSRIFPAARCGPVMKPATPAFTSAVCCGRWVSTAASSPPVRCPRAPTRRSRRPTAHAVPLAQLYFHPPRTFVRIPTEQEEQDRQLLRTREQLLRDRTRTQNRIKAFLAFHHCAVVRPHHWSRAEKETLRQALLPEVLRTCLTSNWRRWNG